MGDARALQSSMLCVAHPVPEGRDQRLVVANGAAVPRPVTESPVQSPCEFK